MSTPTLTTGLASEAGHFYDKDGLPAYDVPNKSTATKCPTCGGSMRGAAAKEKTLACNDCDEGGYIYDLRPATLTDAKKLDLARGVTTITKVLSSPAITNYLLRQQAEAAYTAPAAISNLPFEEWMAKIQADAAEHAKQARNKGTDIHATLERGLNGDTLEGYAYREWYDVFRAGAIQTWDYLPKFHAEKSFTSGYGFGCKVDGVVFPCDEFPNGLVVDFKTKDFSFGMSMKPYDDNVMQLAANAHAAGIPDAEKWNIWFDRTHPIVGFVKIGEDEAKVGWTMFKHCLALSHIRDGWKPSWAFPLEF